LTEGEPSPDEEEDSQKEIITLLESLIMHIPPENMEENLELVKTTLGMAKEWDTLEFWFKEKPELVTNIKLILNRFLIRHAEPEKKDTVPVVHNGATDALSEKLRAALDRALKNLPEDADVTKVIQSVTSQVAESYTGVPSDSQPKIGFGGVPISSAEKAEPSEGSSSHTQPTMSHSRESMTSTAARVKIRKEDIMKSVLEQVKNKINQEEPQKLSAPKIVIPKVTKPKQKIIPYKDETQKPTVAEQKQQELESIPPLQPQERPKEAPKLKVGAFKKKKTKPKITTHATTVPQEPIKPKIVVKPSIQTKAVEVSPEPVPEQTPEILQPIPKQESVPESKPKPTKPKIKLQAKPITKRKQKETKKETKDSAIKFNVVKPTEPKVKDTQIDLFETFSKQEKKGRRRKGKKKPAKVEEKEIKSTEKQELQAPEGKSSPMDGIEFPAETIPYEKMDKTQLYQELIALEGKKYAIEKSRKDFRAKHEKGLISDGNYAAQLDRFKFDLQYISKKINEIRQRIQTL
jgi:hypothetical protein